MISSPISETRVAQIAKRRYYLPGVALVIALWLALGSAIGWDADSEIRTAQRQTEALIDVLDAHTTRLMREAEQLANLVAWQVEKHGVQLPMDAYVKSNRVKLDVFLQIAVIDRDGILRSSTVPDFKPVDLSDREHFRVHLENGSRGLFIGKPVFGRASGKPSTQLSRRVENDKGEFIGVVVISMDPAYLTQLYDDLRLGHHGLVAVLGANDYVIRARRAGPKDTVGTIAPEHSALRQALKNAPSGSYQSKSFIDGIDRITSYKKLRDYPLFVVVEFSRFEYLASFRARRDFLLIAGLMMTALILFASARQVTLLRRVVVSGNQERAAREREAKKAERVDALFQAIPDIAFGLSPEGKLDGLNPHFLKLLGVSKEAIWNATSYDIAAAFFRSDRSADRVAKQEALAAALDNTTSDQECLSFRVKIPAALVYEIRLESRRGGGRVVLIRDITFQTQVSESERDLDITLHAINDAVISTDEQGRIKRMNPMAEQFTGWPMQEALARPLSEVLQIVGPDGEAMDPTQEVLGTGVDLHWEGQRLSATNSNMLRDVTISAAPIRAEDGDVRGVVLVLRDVSRERANARALAISEARYRQLIELLPYAVFVQRAGRICYANPKAVETLAAPSQASLLDREVLGFVHADSQRLVQDRMQQLQEARIAVPTAEEIWLRLDGSILQCEVAAAPYDWDEEPAALVLLQDISARKNAEAQRDRFFELSLDLLCVAGMDGYFKRVNPAFQHVLGWTTQELLARPFADFIHPDDLPATRREIERHLAGNPTEHFENRYLCKSGAVVWLAWKAVRAPDGHIYATARDITDSRRVRQQLERSKSEAESASRAKSAFLATMSHEIRTPMNGVIGMVEVLAQSQLSHDQTNIIRTIRESADSLLRIIDDILDFSKIEAGRMEIERTPLSIRHVVESLCVSLMPVAGKAGVRLTNFVSPRIPDEVLSDGTRLRQLLYNLVGNAIKFSGGRADQAGRVDIRAEPVSSNGTVLEVRFTISDNGIGMSQDTLTNLFTPFTQAEASTTRRFGGTGLGLAICHRLVDLLKGEISVSSQPGEGSVFSATLPFEMANQPTPPRDPALRGIDCILVGSRLFSAEDVGIYLTDAGANVRIVQEFPGTLSNECRRDSISILIDDGMNDVYYEDDCLEDADVNRDIGRVVITRTKERISQAEDANIFFLGIEMLGYQSLQDAVATAAGRVSCQQTCGDSIRPDRPPAGSEEGDELEPPKSGLILVAEDDAINQQVILRQLGLLGYAAELAKDGKEALLLWRSCRFSLILTDLNMPEMDGYELAAAVRREEGIVSRIPILALTANALPDEMTRAKAVGFDGYLTKPLHLNLLKEALERSLSSFEAPTPVAPKEGRAPCDSDASSLKLAVLTDLVGDDRDIVNGLLSDYLIALRGQTQGLRLHARNGNARQVSLIAHRLKSSSRSVGALTLGDLCAKLESAGKAENYEEIEHCMSQVETEVPLVEAAVDAWLGQES
ncbi:PAS domain S-box protein [Cupriavidus pinatubonensis]|uniref:histidine kinase n=1 Tax=Cupriavidus pinatubonensis TaxID=248026 RepID=A0ABN7Y8Z6_9BURK|nr:PAS domain S-box protein [Cupriavidus pinatubonensis]CAG9169865.1 Sensor histidine kinase RcsC [Cupriavidus pinatubonensis]